jgi:hypothetical protein
MLRNSHAVAQSWQQIGDLKRSPVKILLDISTQYLYVAGGGVYNGVDTINGFFYYDGDSIIGLGAGRNDCGNIECNPVNTISLYQGNIVIGGAFQTIGNIGTNGLASWDGASWSGIPGLYNTPYPNYPLDTIAAIYGSVVKDDSLLYITGKFLKAGQDTSYSVARWNGSSWTGIRFLPDFFGRPWPVYNLCFYKDELYVTGSFEVELDGHVEFGIARFDGETWHSVGGGMFGGLSDVYDMVVYKDELYACGTFKSADGNIGNKIMRWNGTEWHDVGGGFCGPSTVSDMIVYQDKLYMAGLFSCVGNGLPANSIAVWDGERWCTFGDNQVFNNRISCLAIWNDELYLCGGFTKIGTETIKYFARYTGPMAETACTAVPVVDLQEIGSLIDVYPNPAGDVIDVSWADLPGSALKLVSVDGRCVREMNVAASNRVRIDLTGLSPGIYSLQLYLPDGLWTGKVVVAQ